MIPKVIFHAVVVLAFVFYIFIQVEFGHILKCTAWNFTSDISRDKNSSSLSSHSALRHNDEEVEGTKVCEKALTVIFIKLIAKNSILILLINNNK